MTALVPIVFFIVGWVAGDLSSKNSRIMQLLKARHERKLALIQAKYSSNKGEK